MTESNMDSLKDKIAELKVLEQRLETAHSHISAVDTFLSGDPEYAESETRLRLQEAMAATDLGKA